MSPDWRLNLSAAPPWAILVIKLPEFSVHPVSFAISSFISLRKTPKNGRFFVWLTNSLDFSDLI